MVTFSVRETGNELLRILRNEVQASGECRLTIDVLIPDVLSGDKEGLCTSILQICQCLTQNLLNASVNIELSKTSRTGGSIDVKINIKGITNKRETTQQFLRMHRADVDALVGRLAYPTTFYANGGSVRFSFSMLFFTEDDIHSNPTKISVKKILLIEDDDITALVFITFMEEWEYVVTRVSDGLSGVSTARLNAHDIILMDTLLPKMSGAEAITAIREFDNKTPIIALSTSPIDGELSSSRYAGANDVLIKPFSADDLQRMLQRYS